MELLITRLAYILCGTVFLFVTAPLCAQTPDPVTVVNSIYNGGSSRGAAFGLDPEERHKYFSKSTAALWDKAEAKVNPNGDEIGAIDFDPSTNTQGADVKSYSIVSNKVSGKTATVVVKLVLDNWMRNSPDDNIIQYNFVLEDGNWMIDDIGSAIDGKGWTLRQLLEFNLKH